MAPNPQLEPRPEVSPTRAMAYRSRLEVTSPLIVIMAIVAFAVGIYFVLTMDWSSTPDFPTLAETVPAPDINSQVPPATPPANP